MQASPGNCSHKLLQPHPLSQMGSIAVNLASSLTVTNAKVKHTLHNVNNRNSTLKRRGEYSPFSFPWTTQDLPHFPSIVLIIGFLPIHSCCASWPNTVLSLSLLPPETSRVEQFLIHITRINLMFNTVSSSCCAPSGRTTLSLTPLKTTGVINTEYHSSSSLDSTRGFDSSISSVPKFSLQKYSCFNFAKTHGQVTAHPYPIPFGLETLPPSWLSISILPIVTLFVVSLVVRPMNNYI